MQSSRSSGKINCMNRALGNPLGNPNYQGPFGNTLLHGAVVSGDLREVKRLLAAGARPGIAHYDGQTPAQAPALLGCAKIKDVLQKGAPRRAARIDRLVPAPSRTLTPPSSNDHGQR